MDFPIVLVRFSEIALKSKYTRATLRRMLRRNLSTMLRSNGIPFAGIEDTWERLIVHTNESERVSTASSRVFGVISTSPAFECKSEIEVISARVSAMAKETMKSGDSFAIRVRRVGKHAFTTNEVAVRSGSAVIETLNRDGVSVHVNLGSPMHEFYIEVRADRSFIYSTVIRGVGGLPLGSQGRVVSRLEDPGDIVAAWLMMKRGCMPVLAMLSAKNDADDLIDLAKSSLLPYGLGGQAILVLPLNDILKNTNSAITKERVEYLALSTLASLLRAEGIVSSRLVDPSDPIAFKLMGELVGIVGMPIFYPLIGFDEEHLRCLAGTVGGKGLSSRIRTQDRLLQVHQGDGQASATFSPDSFVLQYQDKVRKVVESSLGKAQPLV